MAEHPSAADLAVAFRPAAPKGEERMTASAVLNTVLDRTLAFSAELHKIASEYLDDAPINSEHVLQFDAAIAWAFLHWIERWPR
ncbi:hypothetical protein [Mycobacterium sp. 155]|uniref:hypothetical protein n=1 Tax=Mycobacterium sp. 155 TaxID=1157943 RepID=UPI000685F608|nr:hypothetical protein [Mycobacterium sp. 155]